MKLSSNKKLTIKIGTLLIGFNIMLSIIVGSRLSIDLSLTRPDFNILGVSSDNQYLNTQNGTLIQSSFLTAGYKDYRAYILDLYFELYGSPLKGYGSDFIIACDKYGLSKDCTVIPAIAYVETGLCTLGISAKQFNCWGYGGSGKNRFVYKNFSESIENVTNRMASGYGTALLDPVGMAHEYCGPDCGKWGNSVNVQREAIKQLARDNNLPPFN
jgi:hypothetical protein